MMAANTWINSSKYKDNIEYILSIDSTDISIDQYITMFESYFPKIKVIVNDNTTAIEAINNGAKVCTGDIIIVVSDDFICPNNWDEFLLNYLKDKEDFIVKTDDGTQDWIITLPLMDRKYYERFGYIYNPAYQHMFCDTEMTHVADLLNKKIVAPIRFIHNHYTTGRVAKDSINIKNDNTWNQGEKLYLERMKTNFGIESPEGRLACGPSHIQWLKNKGYTL